MVNFEFSIDVYSVYQDDELCGVLEKNDEGYYLFRATNRKIKLTCKTLQVICLKLDELNRG